MELDHYYQKLMEELPHMLPKGLRPPILRNFFLKILFRYSLVDSLPSETKNLRKALEN